MLGRRVLIFGGAAAVGVLLLAVPAAPTGALPSPPLVRELPVVGPAVDDAVAGVPSPVSGTPVLARPKVLDGAHFADSEPLTALTPLSPSPLPARPARREAPAVSTPRAGAPRTPAASSFPGHQPGVPRVLRPGPVAPSIPSAELHTRPVGVRGALGAGARSGAWSTLGTAATSFALWGVLCALALVARWIAVSALRDARRRPRVLSLR